VSCFSAYDPRCYCTTCNQHILTKNIGVPSGIAPLRISMRVGPSGEGVGIALVCISMGDTWQPLSIPGIVYIPHLPPYWSMSEPRATSLVVFGSIYAKVSRPTKSRTITNVLVSCGSHQIIISTKSLGVLGTASLCISKEFILTKSHRVLTLYCNIDFPILAYKCFVWDCIRRCISKGFILTKSLGVRSAWEASYLVRVVNGLHLGVLVLPLF
jgi:hypothetical protein